MTNIIKVNTASPLEKVASYSRLIVVDNWIYVSNTAGRNPETKLIPDDLIEQTEQVFSNIEKALKVVNASLQDVVMSRVFIQTPADTHQVMEYIGTKFKGVNPATTVTNPSLGSQAYKVELEVTAYRGAGNATIQQISI
ncbi:Rid family hydrolase [Psychromonas sp.]|uniref:Rid family hydrolase n=1 Tax=Psychromonas sp. TaxID=1884585 RepID=UPI003A98181F